MWKAEMNFRMELLTNTRIMIYHAKYSITASFYVVIWTNASKHWRQSQFWPCFVAQISMWKDTGNTQERDREKERETNGINHKLRQCLMIRKWYLKPYLSSMRHLLSRTLQCVLKLSKSSMHFGDCWHIANAWLHVGSASLGYGSFSVNNAVDILFCTHKTTINENKKEKNLTLCSFALPFFLTSPHGWSNKKSWKLLHSGSSPGSLHRHVGRKNGNACNVFSAAKHFVTVTVLHATGDIWIASTMNRNEKRVRNNEMNYRGGNEWALMLMAHFIMHE